VVEHDPRALGVGYRCVTLQGELLEADGTLTVGKTCADAFLRLYYLERAYDDAKYGHWSKRPYIDMIIPTLVDPSMAPPGKHVISCFVQYAPYHLDPSLGSWDDNREAFGDAVIDRIAEVARLSTKGVETKVTGQAHKGAGQPRIQGIFSRWGTLPHCVSPTFAMSTAWQQ